MPLSLVIILHVHLHCSLFTATLVNPQTNLLLLTLPEAGHHFHSAAEWSGTRKLTVLACLGQKRRSHKPPLSSCYATQIGIRGVPPRLFGTVTKTATNITILWLWQLLMTLLGLFLLPFLLLVALIRLFRQFRFANNNYLKVLLCAIVGAAQMQMRM